VVSKIFRTGAAIYTASVVVRSTGPNRTKLSIPGSVTFSGKCVETCEDVATNYGKNRTGCFAITTPSLTLPSSPSSFWPKNEMVLIPHPPYSPHLAPCDFYLLPKIKLKLKGRRFDTTEIQVDSQTVLNTLTEKDFQEAFQKWRRRWDRCLHAGGNYFEGDGSR
jgi:hypothetical protein